jgi:hypothetical protein
VEEKNFAARRRKPEDTTVAAVFFCARKMSTQRSRLFRDKVGKKSRRSPSSTDLVGRPQDAVGAGFEKSGTVGAQ